MGEDQVTNNNAIEGQCFNIVKRFATELREGYLHADLDKQVISAVVQYKIFYAKGKVFVEPRMVSGLVSNVGASGKCYGHFVSGIRVTFGENGAAVTDAIVAPGENKLTFDVLKGENRGMSLTAAKNPSLVLDVHKETTVRTTTEVCSWISLSVTRPSIENIEFNFRLQKWKEPLGNESPYPTSSTHRMDYMPTYESFHAGDRFSFAVQDNKVLAEWSLEGEGGHQVEVTTSVDVSLGRIVYSPKCSLCSLCCRPKQYELSKLHGVGLKNVESKSYPYQHNRKKIHE